MKSMVPTWQRRAVNAKDDTIGCTMPARISRRDSFDFDINASSLSQFSYSDSTV